MGAKDKRKGKKGHKKDQKHEKGKKSDAPRVKKLNPRDEKYAVLGDELRELYAPKERQWRCRICQTKNSLNVLACAACNNQKPRVTGAEDPVWLMKTGWQARRKSLAIMGARSLISEKLFESVMMAALRQGSILPA